MLVLGGYYLLRDDVVDKVVAALLVVIHLDGKGLGCSVLMNLGIRENFVTAEVYSTPSTHAIQPFRGGIRSPSNTCSTLHGYLQYLVHPPIVRLPVPLLVHPYTWTRVLFFPFGLTLRRPTPFPTNDLLVGPVSSTHLNVH